MSDIFDLLEKQLNSLPFGTLGITVKRHDSHNASLDFQKITSHKVDGNDKALAIVIALLKSLQANKETGFLTFTITMTEGNATRVQVQDTQRIAL
jgi:hypothetical protein